MVFVEVNIYPSIETESICHLYFPKKILPAKYLLLPALVSTAVYFFMNLICLPFPILKMYVPAERFSTLILSWG